MLCTQKSNMTKHLLHPPCPCPIGTLNTSHPSCPMQHYLGLPSLKTTLAHFPYQDPGVLQSSEPALPLGVGVGVPPGTVQSSGFALLVDVGVFPPGTDQSSRFPLLLDVGVGVVVGVGVGVGVKLGPTVFEGTSPGGTRTYTGTQSLTYFTCQLSKPTSPFLLSVPGSRKHSTLARIVQAEPNPGFMYGMPKLIVCHVGPSTGMVPELQNSTSGPGGQVPVPWYAHREI